MACRHRLELICVEHTHLEKLDESGESKVDTEEYQQAWQKVKSAHGMVVPGGFGNR